MESRCINSYAELISTNIAFPILDALQDYIAGCRGTAVPLRVYLT